MKGNGLFRCIMRIIKVFLGLIFCMLALGWSITALVELQPLWLIGTVIALVIAILLFRRTKKDKQYRAKALARAIYEDHANVSTTYEPSPIPQNVLRDMKKCYTLMQARRDAEIMFESFKLAQETTNLEVFCMRYDLCRQKAHTLLQAEQAGVRGIKKLRAHDACVAVLDCADSLRVEGLQNCIRYAIMSAEALKTDKGKLNRYAKLLIALEKKENMFVGIHEYADALDSVKTRILQLGGMPDTLE